MAIEKRGKYYSVRFWFKGKEIRRSSGTSSKTKALEFEAHLKKQLWEQSYLKKSPEKLWVEAVERYLEEATKKTIRDDVVILRWLDVYLRNKLLSEINSDLLNDIKKEKQKENVSPATINHYLKVIISILRKAHKWGWISWVPAAEMMPINNKRIRWLTLQEAEQLIRTLPKHLAHMANFTLATGLRSRNVRLLKWSQINFEKRHAYVSAEDIKNNKALPVPLNTDALMILSQQQRVNEYVFNYNGKPVTQCSTKAFRKALKKCGIENFRWHDLRHTWASWHIQNGTSLQELQALGGWSDFTMVLRYAHLSSDHLKDAAERITRTKPGQEKFEIIVNRPQPLDPTGAEERNRTADLLITNLRA